MITVTDALREFLFTDQAAKECLAQGTLNLRAYAARIQPQIEERTLKSVKLGSMVMALSRISQTLESQLDLRPNVVIEGLSVKSGLTVINFEKTSHIISILSQANIKRSDKDFFVISESLAEIAVTAPEQHIHMIKDLVRTLPKSEFQGAIALTLRFNDYYVTVPNVLYAFVSSLAVKRINLLQIVSTLTEVSFILESKYMDQALDSFRIFLKRN